MTVSCQSIDFITLQSLWDFRLREIDSQYSIVFQLWTDLELTNITHGCQFINTVTGSYLTTNSSINSETIEIKQEGIPLVRVGNANIQLVDTPGFDDSRDETDTEVFMRITEWLALRWVLHA
jgi:hypothetical protein